MEFIEFTTKKLAELTGYTPRAIQKWTAEGYIKPIRRNVYGMNALKAIFVNAARQKAKINVGEGFVSAELVINGFGFTGAPFINLVPTANTIYTIRETDGARIEYYDVVILFSIASLVEAGFPPEKDTTGTPEKYLTQLQAQTIIPFVPTVAERLLRKTQIISAAVLKDGQPDNECLFRESVILELKKELETESPLALRTRQTSKNDKNLTDLGGLWQLN